MKLSICTYDYFKAEGIPDYGFLHHCETHKKIGFFYKGFEIQWGSTAITDTK
jgi:hypothetical protein